DALICEILAAIGDRRCVPDLMLALGSEDRRVRIAAASALAARRNLLEKKRVAEVAGKIAEMAVREKDASREGLLVAALGKLGAPETVDLLAQIALDPRKRNVQVHRAAVFALGATGTKEALEYVLRALESESAFVRDAALSVLEKAAGTGHGFDPRKDPSEQPEPMVKFRKWFDDKYGAEE
ncbi:MAG: HEAT repeat domain-containing protein, partial [Planctomycetota bacterium]